MGRFKPFALAALLAAAAAACTSGPSAPVDAQAYVQQIAEARAFKDKTFREDPEPIPRDKIDVFLPLKYYPPDPTYAAPAELKLANERPVFDMPTSTGTIRKMERVGVLEFTLRGQPMSLAAFVGQPIPVNHSAWTRNVLAGSNSRGFPVCKPRWCATAAVATAKNACEFKGGVFMQDPSAGK